MHPVIQPAIHFAHFNMTDPFRLQVGQTLAVADSIRQILLGIEGDHTDGQVDFTFSGHSQDGDNQGDHQHAYVMPLDTTGDGHLDQVLIRAPLGFSIQNLVALEAIQDEVLFGETRLELTRLSHQPPDWFSIPAIRWISVTPVMTFRHYKKSAGSMTDWWQQEVTRSCLAQGLPIPTSVEMMAHRSLPTHWKTFSFERPSRPNRRRPFHKGILLEFDSPVIGPISVGELVHFGMGRMVPDV